MDFHVHPLCHRFVIFSFRKMGKIVNPGIDRCRRTIYHTALIAENARLHIVKIILTGLFESRIVTFLLELLSLQIITRVILITDSERNNVQFFQVTPHGQHLQHGILSTIVRVLGPSLTLGNPYILLLLRNSEMDVPAHQLRCSQGLTKRQSATNGKGLVHTDESLDPRIDEQVVTDTNLYGSGITILDKLHVEKSRIKNNVTMVADEGITFFQLRT